MTTTVSLTECTEEYKQQQHQQVLDAEVVHEWECVLRHQDKHHLPLFMVGGISVVFGISYYLSTDTNFLYMWPIFVAIFVPVSYFLFDVDYDYKGQITPKGIIIQKTERVPDIFYKATRGMAYIGIVVCVIAALMVGPLAFVGAGAFALLSFKMTGFHKQTEIDIHPFHQNSSYQVLISRLDDMYQWDIYTFLCDVPDFIDTEFYDLHIMSFECKASDFPHIEKVLKQYIRFAD
ncbi:hypothetical protein CAG70_06395 [Photobacterium halotolerans]|uniref:hypothetical protein n=1 Tax=Photobacterium halotolerans TaxID=265726 RepID=UPI001372521C|nr:hypothetical protein [Photobacterium halotolerans]NAX46628.1 hypothetical protein [Photobacterium halotolerans]